MWNNTGKMGQLHKDNKGFTLVELVIVIGISAILMAAISFFLLMGTRTYEIAKDEIDLQSETQIVMNQIKDRILECNNLDNFDSNNQFVLYSISEKASGEKVTSQIDKKEVFWLDITSGKLYYRELTGEAVKTDNGAVFSGDNEKYLLAEYISSLYVGRVADTDTVEIKVTLSQGGRDYSIQDTVKLRNRMIEKPGESEVTE